MSVIDNNNEDVNNKMDQLYLKELLRKGTAWREERINYEMMIEQRMEMRTQEWRRMVNNEVKEWERAFLNGEASLRETINREIQNSVPNYKRVESLLNTHTIVPNFPMEVYIPPTASESQMTDETLVRSWGLESNDDYNSSSHIMGQSSKGGGTRGSNTSISTFWGERDVTHAVKEYKRIYLSV